MLNKICTNLKTSKRLKELGIEGETQFYAVTYSVTYLVGKAPQLGEFYCYMLDGEFYNEFGERVTMHVDGFCRAYSLEQIVERLPAQIKINDVKHHLVTGKYRIEYQTYCDCDSHEYCPVQYKYEFDKLKNENLATTAARLLINLKKDKII